MFVSPPVPLGTKQRLPRLLSARRRPAESQVNGDVGGAERRTASGDPGDKEFISPPREYADRARDEIRKRLLGQRRESEVEISDQESKVSSEVEISDQESKVSSVGSGRSSIFSCQSERSCLTSLGSEDIESEICQRGTRKAIWLEEALPRRFDDMYAPEILQDAQNLLPNGRPSFTKRELLDWDLNDIRSLLIVERLRPEWGGRLPEIYLHSQTQAHHAMPHFRLQLLQLEAPDAMIIETLVTSDIYMEANLDFDFKLMSARYTVAAARQRHERLVGVNEPVMRLSKPEWRNIIENYVLNLAVEAQCRFDFKDACLRYRLEKKQRQQIKRPNMPPPSTIPAKKSSSTSLLRQALLKGSYQHHGQDPATSNPDPATLTKEEKSQIWLQCQVQVYRRLNLDWKPDGM